MSVCVSVCLLVTFVSSAKKRLNRSRCHLGVDSCGSKEPCIRWGCHGWTNPFVAARGGNMAMWLPRIWGRKKFSTFHKLLTNLGNGIKQGRSHRKSYVVYRTVTLPMTLSDPIVIIIIIIIII